MTGALFYVDALPSVGAVVTVSGDDGFHAATVRRLRRGERLMLGDGAGELAWCEVDDVDRTQLRTRLLHRWHVPLPTPSVTVVQALPKSERFQLAIESATEAGADAFVAWQAARCVARWDGAKADKGLRRWRAVARSAAMQSRRAYIPAVSGPVVTRQVALRAETDGVLVLHESAAEVMSEKHVAQVDSLTIVVGPEGGISDTELMELTNAGAVAVRLGPTVLRTSTAAAVALGALGVLTGRWHSSDPDALGAGGSRR
ncbi:MAG: 16S rRNA (uracil(1498)-N(3))-methyltransferase [Mycobacteriaceae bacterium]|nr:16S rRNA (uracil(1498)-N(3))-methyltransferase [Mycobacteriaceae bacterium]